MDIFFAFIVITSTASVYSLISRYVTMKFGNMERVKELQKEMNRLNKEYSEALKKNDKEKIKRAEKNHERVFPMLMEVMKLQFKPLIFLLPLLLVLPPLLKSWFPYFAIELPFSIPVFIQNFERFPNWRNVFGSVGWFWISFILSSLFISLWSKIVANKNK